MQQQQQQQLIIKLPRKYLYHWIFPCNFCHVITTTTTFDNNNKKNMRKTTQHFHLPVLFRSLLLLFHFSGCYDSYNLFFCYKDVVMLLLLLLLLFVQQLDIGTAAYSFDMRGGGTSRMSRSQIYNRYLRIQQQQQEQQQMLTSTSTTTNHYHPTPYNYNPINHHHYNNYYDHRIRKKLKSIMLLHSMKNQNNEEYLHHYAPPSDKNKKKYDSSTTTTTTTTATTKNDAIIFDDRMDEDTTINDHENYYLNDLLLMTTTVDDAAAVVEDDPNDYKTNDENDDNIHNDLYEFLNTISDEEALIACRTYLQRHQQLGKWNLAKERKQHRIQQYEQQQMDRKNNRKTKYQTTIQVQQSQSQQQQERTNQDDISLLSSPSSTLYTSTTTTNKTHTLNEVSSNNKLTTRVGKMGQGPSFSSNVRAIGKLNQFQLWENTTANEESKTSFHPFYDHDEKEEYEDEEENSQWETIVHSRSGGRSGNVLQQKELLQTLLLFDDNDHDHDENNNNNHGNHHQHHPTSKNNLYYYQQGHSSNHEIQQQQQQQPFDFHDGISTTTTNQYYRIDEVTPSVQHLRRSKTAKIRWSDPVWKQKWYEKRWGSNVVKQHRTTISDERKRLKTIQPKWKKINNLHGNEKSLFSPTSSFLPPGMNSINDKKYVSARLYYDMDQQQQNQQYQHQQSSSSSDYDPILLITASSSSSSSVPREYREYMNFMSNPVLANMTEDEMVHAIISYRIANQKRITSRQVTYQYRKQLLQKQMEMIFAKKDHIMMKKNMKNKSGVIRIENNNNNATTITITPSEQQVDGTPHQMFSTSTSMNPKNISTTTSKTEWNDIATRPTSSTTTTDSPSLHSDDNDDVTTMTNDDHIQRFKQFQRSERAKRAYQTRLENINNNRKNVSSTTTTTSKKSNDERSRNGKHGNNNNNNNNSNMKKMKILEDDLNMNNGNNNNNFDLQGAILQCFSSNITSVAAFDNTSSSSTSLSSLSSTIPMSSQSPTEALYRIEQVLNVLSSHSPFVSGTCDEKVVQLQMNVPLDLLLHDITIILIPNKLIRRRHVLQRILHDWFHLRGKCIPPTTSSSITMNVSVDQTTPILSLEQQRHQSLFVTKCSIQDLGTFVLYKIRNLQKKSTIYF